MTWQIQNILNKWRSGEAYVEKKGYYCWENTLTYLYPWKEKKKENQLKKGALNADLCPVLEKSSLQPAGILTAAGQLCRHEDKECIF